ncbi:MAG: RNase H family protein, partial [Clostridium sp.]|nr:RNase H family protein [Clostridium sp.]
INGVIAYVDGSFSIEDRKYSFGCILIDANGKVLEEFGYCDEAVALELRNVAGEIQGVMYAVKKAIDLGYKAVEIRYDYEGIEKWVTMEWKAYSEVVRKYIKYIEKSSNNIKISFRKVTAHSGDAYNEQVDKLAKKGLRSGRKIYRGDSWVKIEDILEEDIELVLELLKDENNSISIEKKKLPYQAILYTILLGKEKVTIRCECRDRVVLIQGKFGSLSSIVLTYISQIVDPTQMDTVRNECFQIDINKECVKDQFEGYLFMAKKHLPDKICRVLRQSVYNLNIKDNDMDDASFLIYPAVRGLEGSLKYILGLFNIDYSNGFGEIFESQSNYSYKITNSTYIESIGDKRRIGQLCKMYTHYKRQRHPISHWNDPHASIDDTKIITNCSVAHQIIRDTLQLIEDYYNI